MKFTTGPWELCFGWNNAFAIEKTEEIIANIPGNRDKVIYNAKLISTSPLLYAELKSLVSLLEPIANAGTLTQSWLDALNRAKAVLRKAEGE